MGHPEITRATCHMHRHQPGPSHLHAQLLYFLVVVFAVQDVPLLAAFQDGPFLAVDFHARGLVDSRFLGQKLFQNLAHFEANGVPVFYKFHFIYVGERIRHRVRHFVHLVAADSHNTALYLRTNSLLTLRNSSW